jgi:hypothetical protein
MDTRWEIWLDDAYGNRVGILDGAAAWEVVRTVNETGSFQLVLPGDFDDSLLLDDGFVEFWRAPAGGALRWLTVGLITDIEYADDENGRETILIAGPDAIDLLDRRIIAYPKGGTKATQSDYADDLSKQIARENLGSSSTDSARDLSALGFSVTSNIAAAPVVDKTFSWRNCLKTIQEIADASRKAGTNLYFDLVPKLTSQTQIGFTFQVFTGQRGTDRTADLDNPVLFGKKWGNLQNARLTRSRRKEANYAYVGGVGDDDTRLIEEVSDAALINSSPWARREIFVDARNESSTDGLYDRGLAELSARRPRYRLTGTILDTRQIQYGRDWDFGDRITCQHRGLEFSAEIRSMKISVNEQGQEKIDAKIEAEL